ncbi:TetR family transcriptional regulator [Rhodopseudomonas thermotolerans]|uniref:TetR family transcriptional regulator n=2 Tax=Rhodopseudomonas TaxID=1073 RepID=A0A336JSA1_9BRAD|nr:MULTISPECIES: TetR/AcrR family transcriptional regulator [Rhodopseudomonas]RED31921.1 TetR family transcriptional regulator [Rhodopseudomonas pentothenatexigens]REF93302.1 TetR family transcriptional regulator [Rhodopseudomonas thermotolerans]SSW91593.1 TetR family transcriptional regulator [Rhodopseudomonas pentothenatexigens]
MKATKRRTNPERSSATQAALIAAARQAFVARGYADTSTPDLVEAAGVTRGALYHHFADKQALFRAVVEAESAAVAAAVEAGAVEDSPIAALISGGEAYLAAMAAPGRTRLLLIEAPAVLGRAEADAIDARHGVGTSRDGLQAAVDGGAIAPIPIDAAAKLLGAAFDRAALEIAQGGDRGECLTVLRALIEGLRR